jgi:hypothetical protein
VGVLPLLLVLLLEVEQAASTAITAARTQRPAVLKVMVRSNKSADHDQRLARAPCA